MDEKRMRLRFAGRCRVCGAELAARTEAVYERATRTVRCLSCDAEASRTAARPANAATAGGAAVPDRGRAGASARREHERRRARDEQRIRDRWGPLGGVAVALSSERQSTRAWAQGAVGEERLGRRLDSLVEAGVEVLHDRRIRGTRANIDHLAVTPAGVWVIDAKRYRGRPTLRVDGGLLRPRVERLLVGRRDCTRLVEGVIDQVGRVSEVVGAVPVRGALCFVDADWPLIGGSFTIRGVDVLWPRLLAKRLTETAAGEVDVVAVRDRLAERFPRA